MKLLPTVILFVLLSGCSQKSPDFFVKFNQTAYLRLRYCNLTHRSAIRLDTWNIVPHSENPSAEDTLHPGKYSRLYSLKVLAPQKGNLVIENQKYDLFLVPDDTISLEIDFGNNTQWHDSNLSFSGRYHEVQEYYLQRTVAMREIEKRRNNIQDLRIYQQAMDSTLHDEKYFLETYAKSHSLPSWFVRHAKLEAMYSNASMRLNRITSQRHFNPEKPIPSDYLNFLENVPINNPSAAYLLPYWYAVADYVNLKADRKAGASSDWWLKEQETAKKFLDSTQVEWHMARQLSGYSTMNPSGSLKLIDEFSPAFKNRDLAKLIRANALTKIKFLKPGDPAPNFVLTDRRDSLVSLRSFQGKIVILCFWFPGCKPCLSEFSHENALVEKYKNQPVRIVSIGTTSERQAWLTAIQKHNLKTVNLHANENWQKNLEQKYGIQSYPHYVLIDPSGRIIKNNASRPSQKLADTIDKILAGEDAMP